MRGQKTTPTTVAILIYALDIYAGNSAPWIRNKFSNYLILIQYTILFFFPFTTKANFTPLIRSFLQKFMAQGSLNIFSMYFYA